MQIPPVFYHAKKKKKKKNRTRKKCENISIFDNEIENVFSESMSIRLAIITSI